MSGPRRLRVRYPRVAAAVSAAVITATALLGAGGVLPSGDPTSAYAAPATDQVAAAQTPDTRTQRPSAGSDRDTTADAPSSRGAPAAPGGSAAPDDSPRLVLAQASAWSYTAFGVPRLPADSGDGKRVVFDQSEQQVWLVTKGDAVQRTYPVSGSLYDNLQPGTYQVFSKSMHAIGVDDSGTMMYMVRFAHGENAAIGFHDIPIDDGHLVQTRKQLGTPQSHGCIRQYRPDAKALWRFTEVGTTVVVVA